MCILVIRTHGQDDSLLLLIFVYTGYADSIVEDYLIEGGCFLDVVASLVSIMWVTHSINQSHFKCSKVLHGRHILKVIIQFMQVLHVVRGHTG